MNNFFFQEFCFQNVKFDKIQVRADLEGASTSIFWKKKHILRTTLVCIPKGLSKIFLGTYHIYLNFFSFLTQPTDSQKSLVLKKARNCCLKFKINNKQANLHEIRLDGSPSSACKYYGIVVVMSLSPSCKIMYNVLVENFSPKSMDLWTHILKWNIFELKAWTSGNSNYNALNKRIFGKS